MPTPAPPPPSVPSTAPTVLRAPAVSPAAVFELHPAVGLSAQYTTNFDRSQQNRRANLRTSLSPGLTLLINGARAKGQIAYSLSAAQDLFVEQTNLFHSLAGQIAWDASPQLTFTASDALTRSDEPTQADRLGLRRERRVFLSNRFALGSTYRLGEIGTSGGYSLATFFDENGTDTTSHALSAGLATRLGVQDTGGLGYSYTTSSTAGGEGINGHQLTASFGRQLSLLSAAGVSGSYALRTGSGRGEAAGGVTTLWSISAFTAYAIPTWSLNGSLGVSGVTGAGGAQSSSVSSLSTFAYRFARATATLSWDQGFSETFLEGEDFGLVETRGVSASLSYPLSPAASGTVSGFYRQNEVPGRGGQPDRSDDNTGVSFTVSVRLRPWLTLRFDVAHTRQTSSVGGGFTETRALGEVAAGF